MRQRLHQSQHTAALTGNLSTCAMSPTTAAATEEMRLNDPALPRADMGRQQSQQQSREEPLSVTQPQQQQTTSAIDVSNRGKENSKPQLNNVDCEDVEMKNLTQTNDRRCDSSALSSRSSNTSTLYSSTQPEAQFEKERLPFIDSAKRLHYNSPEESNSELEEDIEDDDISECSGDTVIANDFPDPPLNATQEEMTRYYWDICYGDHAESMMEERRRMSGLRSAPAKSCLSIKKMKNETTASSMTPRRLHPSPQGTIEFNDECALSTPNDEDDPSNNNSATATISKKYHHSAVKFGTNSAAEFDKLLPITEMTPMPTHLVQEIFPSDTKEEPAEEQQVSRETARNVATLAEWDDLFEDEDDIEQSTPQRKRGRRRTPYKSKNRKSSKSRRDSTIFSKERRSLLETSDDENMLPLSVTIDPMQYTSPSTIDVTERDSLNRDIIPEKSQINRDSLESTTSVCISPSSLASSERSMLGRETPNSARTSSSNILRAVHASGAELPSHSPQAIGGMRPNQLNYSPGSTALSDSSPLNSDNQSLGSDVMSSFSQHTIDSRNDADIFQHHLSILSNHPLQMLHLQIGDMLVMLQAGTKDFITFLDEDIFRSLTPSTYLALIKGQDDKKYLFPELFTSIASWNDLHNIESFQSILGNEIASACSDKFLFSSTEKIQLATSLIKEEQVIASCVKKCYDNAAFEWSNIELAMANEAAIKFEELVKQNKKDIEAKKQAPVKSKTKQLVQDEVSLIKALEEELVGEINRLASFEREQQILRSNLELERYSPIVMLSEEIRSSIHRLEPFDAASGFNIPLLDRAAEVTIEIDGERIIEIGFSMKGEGISIQLLQALLLGQIDTATDISYPIPIRKSLSSRLMDNQCLKSAFRDAFTLLSRVDSLVACVKSLETEFMCTMSSEANGDVTIAFSAHQGGRVIKVGFVFESLLASTWHVATVPADVKVSIVSAENDQDNISESLQQKAYTILKSAGASDPILLKRVVFGVMSHVSEATGVQ